jgi:hypothetical protein
MFADDTQLFNKNDESVKKSFDILIIYEKTPGSKVNYGAIGHPCLQDLEILKYLDTKPLVLIQVCAYLNNI